MVPVAVGLALSAACIAAAFEDDVLAGSFGWRQPLGLLTAAAVAIGVLPGIAAIGSGRWHMPTLTLTSVLGQFPENPPEGDYRILWIGNPQVMPVPGWTLEPGIGYAVTDDGPFTQYETWPGRPSKSEQDLGDVVRQLASESTLRGGRLLAPYAIRYIVVPIADGATSTVDQPLPLPTGLVDALDDQLDFAAPLTRPLNFLVYENTAWIPTRAFFAEANADDTRQAGFDSLARLELRLAATPIGIGVADNADVQFDAQPGAVTIATGVDQRWKMNVGGQAIPAAAGIRGDDRLRHRDQWSGHAQLPHRCVEALVADRSVGAVAAARPRPQQVRHDVDQQMEASPRRRRSGGTDPVDRWTDRCPDRVGRRFGGRHVDGRRCRSAATGTGPSGTR